MSKRPVNRNIGDETPIFGIDVQEIEVLRNLERIVWMYINEDASMENLVTAANDVRLSRRKRKAN